MVIENVVIMFIGRLVHVYFMIYTLFKRFGHIMICVRLECVGKRS